jgi:hypothetical protein
MRAEGHRQSARNGTEARHHTQADRRELGNAMYKRLFQYGPVKIQIAPSRDLWRGQVHGAAAVSQNVCGFE